MTKNTWRAYVVGLALVVALGLVGCEPYGYVEADVTGAWDFSTNAGGKGVLELTQSGKDVSGTVSQEPFMQYKFPVSGSVNGFRVELTLKFTTFTVHLRGTVLGDKMEGTYTTSSDKSGSWAATRR